MRKLILLVAGLALSGASYADDDSIYVITNKTVASSQAGELAALEFPAYIEQDSFSTKVEANALKSAIGNARSAICSSVGDATVKVYFTFDADAKVFGIGTSTGAGIEVTFECASG